MRVITECYPEARSVLDPFVGSGTVMMEAMMLGLDFVGRDINPLSMLICEVKKGPFFADATKRKAKELVDRISHDASESIEVDFSGRDKWFRLDVQIVLSKIRRAIRTEPATWCRRFFWLTLAETIRLTSNSRTSTYKLHIREAENIARDLCPLSTFKEILEGNVEKLSEAAGLLKERQLTTAGRYAGRITIEQHDATSALPNDTSMDKCDLMVTSPPYGDNVTTVPYGQYSYLPLSWIDMVDIHPAMDTALLKSTHEIDFRSLGGSRVNAIEDTKRLREISKSFAETIDALKDEPRDRSTRVAAFCRDLNRCIRPIMDQLNTGAYMVWTVGNRRVANRLVPTDQILRELLNAAGAVFIHDFQRKIPTKRMAVKNSVAATMRSETIIVMRKKAL